MITINGNSADEVWKSGFSAVTEHKAYQSSRAGTTQELLHVGFSITDPRQRWVVSRTPAMNPAFAIAEMIWILCGRNDAYFLTYWNRQLSKYAGSGEKYHGAYGFRLRHGFAIDQLERAFHALQANQSTRQVILQIWHPEKDLPTVEGEPADADIPCNVMSMLKVRDEKLEWLQINRSNDIYRGLPHNLVQFTTLQEVIAGWLQIEIGSYNHISDSLHIYEHDLGEVSIDPHAKAISNPDTLSLGKQDSDAAFRLLETYTEKLISESLEIHQFHSMMHSFPLSSGYLNLFLILCAEAARRRKWREEVQMAINQCSNLLFVYMWERWEMRLAG